MNKKVKVLKDWDGHKAGEVLELEEAVAKTLIGTEHAEEVVDADGVQEELTKAVGTFKGVLTDAITEAVKGATAELKAGATDPARITGVKDNADDDPKGGFKNFGEFVSKVKIAHTGGEVDDRLKRIKAAQGQNEADGSEGGYLLVPEFSNRIVERMTEDPTGILARCDKYVMGSNALTILGVNDADRTAAATRYGGVIAYWVAEAAQITASTMAFRQIQLRLNKIAALVYCTDEMLDDAALINLPQKIEDKVSEAMTDTVLEAIMFGDGVGKPHGALASTNPALVAVAIENNQLAATIVTQNISKMYWHMPPKGYSNAIWLFNPECGPQFDLLNANMEVAGGYYPLYMPPGGLSAQPYSSLKGRPAIPTEHCEALGAQGDVVYADFSQYALGMRGTVKSAMSIHLRFDYEETCFRFSFRIDGRSLWDKYVTPRKGAGTFYLSPFVALAVRA